MSNLDLSPAVGQAAIVEAADRFRIDGHFRLESAFQTETADALHRHLLSELDWWRVVNQGEKVWDLGPEAIRAMEQSGDGPLIESVHKGAREGFQFIFDSVRVSDSPDERAARGLLIDRLIDELNAPQWLELFRNITGRQDIALVDGQATRYLPGHFLTAHDDDIEGKGRIAAYVINLSPVWRTEWGGLLLFQDANGDILHGLKPTFNAIHLFSVPQPHSVSLVAPFADAPRLAITGWLRK